MFKIYATLYFIDVEAAVCSINVFRTGFWDDVWQIVVPRVPDDSFSELPFALPLSALTLMYRGTALMYIQEL